jgi:hypothetical protein
MKSPLVLTLMAGLTVQPACTSLRPVEASPNEVQHLILDERIIEPGDRVRLVTADEAVHEFRVTEVDREQRMIVGGNERVGIDEIVAVDTREASVGRTALLVGGLGYGLAYLIAIAIAPALILGGV